ncbi:sensor domain-containing diguanylate cyclase [Acidovorax sp. CCYZU-2555]|uniref:GGDEF domain-containing protein n=1 Tax=Acidovorax sp. CCYZU-2555 TaxID=2835042 RepID=UPI001BD158B8|nr:sensor domain-containing diguanylate cyclase [Acidovorax sp. CCYZU-2555]MBS7778807.1 diguanylate cyclase [Acidovorax sp. CCYZU-2555]
MISILRLVALALDQLEVAVCVFDTRHRTLLWNDTFVQFFPEHAGQVHEGEDYRENLRRFYLSRLSEDELPAMERYVEEGVQRHHQQQRAFEFDHHGYRVRAASVSLGAFGRVRLWRKTTPLLPGMQDRINPRLVQLPGQISADTARALESLADGILMVDEQDRAVWANHAFLVLYGLPDIDSLSGLQFDAVYAETWRREEPTAGYARGVAILKERQRFSGAPYVLALPQNRWVRIVELRGTQANGSSFFSHVDVTASRRQQEELRKLTQHLESLAGKDALTALANRRRFDEVLDAAWRESRQFGSALSLLMLDVDHFKQLNDAHGHPFGDEVLKSFARVLTHVVQRPGSVVARYGGEEFAILLPDTDAASAAKLAEFLRLQVEGMSLGTELTGVVRITVSIGIVCTSHCAADAAATLLVNAADKALYEAKRRGRNQIALAV